MSLTTSKSLSLNPQALTSGIGFLFFLSVELLSLLHEDINMSNNKMINGFLINNNVKWVF